MVIKMEMRKLNKLNITTSLLGFGTMRLPLDANGQIDEQKAEEMLNYAINNGVNYIDTAYPYHNGESEPFVGKVLKKYRRDKYYLATKLPMWKIQTIEDVYNTFNEQLKRLDTKYVDFYLLHAMNKERFELTKKLGIIKVLEQFQKEGKIKYIGFSFHDSYEVFTEIINYYHWDFCQIQFNYMDTDEQAGLKGYNLAKTKQIPMIVMEPVKGGLLAKLPDPISQLLPRTNSELTDSSFALRYVASYDNVAVILSGMSSLYQVKDNVQTFTNYEPLSNNEKEAINEVVKALKAGLKNGCTGCRYCMPCPKGVAIPNLFSAYNEYGIYQDEEKFVKKINNFISQNSDYSKCIKCGKCEKLCPQAIKIRDELEKIKIAFEKI